MGGTEALGVLGLAQVHWCEGSGDRSWGSLSSYLACGVPVPVLTGLWVRPVSVLTSCREDSEMALLSNSVFVIEWASSNGCYQRPCPQGELPYLPASPGGSERSPGRSDPGFFQIIASALDPSTYGILCAQRKKKNRGEVSIFHSPLALLKVSPIGLQTKPSKGSSSWCRTPRLKIMMWSLNPSLLVVDHSSCNYPPHLRAAHPWIWVLTIYHLHSSTLSHCGSFFSVFSYRKHFLLFWSYQ